MGGRRLQRKKSPTLPSGEGEQVGTALQALTARLLERFPKEGEFTTELPGLMIYRFDGPTAPAGYLLEPSVCLILQGSKRVFVGENEYIYGQGGFVVTSIDLPVIAQILEASEAKPYVGAVLKLDRLEIAQLILEHPPVSGKGGGAGEAIEIGALSPRLLGAAKRLIDLLEEPDSIAALAPLARKELLFRLLRTECGPKIRQIATGGSPTHQISRPIAWIKDNLGERLRVEHLARLAGMSVSTFHHHFRALTALSPLQFQKHLRLNEARRLMLARQLDASAVAFAVGYESPSQFSREYSRLFGSPPLRDIKNLSARCPKVTRPLLK